MIGNALGADGLDLSLLLDLGRVGGAVTVFAWFVLVLVKRSDGLQRENIEELRNQRDEYRTRLEIVEGHLTRVEADLAKAHALLARRARWHEEKKNS